MPATGIAIVSSELKSLFLDGLALQERKVILSAATQRRYAANSVITSEGHPADHFFLITNGLARYFIITERGRKILFQWLGPGDVLGGRAVLSRHTSYLASTETVKDTSLLVWDRPTIRSLVVRYPRLLENALLTASDFVAWYLMSHISLVDHTARQRVAKVLVTLARTVGQKTPAGIALHITNEELANAANVTQFTASRLVSGWQRNRDLVKRRGSILLLSPERLSYE
jgi:CRP/FNR family transcriptional regulator, nitrogen oxide reductase regulator